MQSLSFAARGFILGTVLLCGSAHAMTGIVGEATTLGKAAVPLNGPWKFRLGDNPAWADPRFDDSEWETVELSPPPGAHDDDVGLSGYVPGWGARGHAGQSGYGWYRLHLRVASSTSDSLALAGPPAADSSYQVFWNGSLLGQDGDFHKTPPKVVSIQPHLFPITQVTTSGEQAQDIVVAVRVWMAPWDLGDAQGGGMRIAPTLGTASGIKGVYTSQWIETLRGYVVEVIEACGFAFFCFSVCLLGRIEHTTRYNWLCAALLLTGGYRLNQAVFAWTQFESVPMFEIVSLGLLYPLSLSAWTVGWSRLLNIRNVYWARAFTVVTILYLGLSLTQHWYAGSMPLLRSSTTLHIAVTSVRLFYLVSTCWLLYLLIRSKCRSSALLCVLVVLASVGQFAPELSAIGVPGIWFPFDTGVSRAQFAYALFFICAAVALWGEFLHIAERKATRIESLDGGDAVAIPMKGRAL
jgi:hypothetical protein